MKTCIFCFALVLLCSVCAFGQVDSVRVWRYADLTYPLGGFSSKSRVQVDFGESSSGWLRSPDMLEDVDGKAVKFKSPVDALNWMSVRGWDLVQSYQVEEDAGLGVRLRYIHYIMRREEWRRRE